MTDTRLSTATFSDSCHRGKEAISARDRVKLRIANA